MTKEEKTKIIDSLAAELAANPNFYITDISRLTGEKNSKLRRMCFEKQVKLLGVKNTLLRKAMEKTDKQKYEPLFASLAGASSLMFCATANVPAKVIKEFRKAEKIPVLKGAFIEESAYVGDNQLDMLANIKSKNELIGDVIALLQSPAKNVIGALQSGKSKLAGIVKTLSDKPE